MEVISYLIIWLATKVVNNSLLSIGLILSIIALRFVINRFFMDKVARWVMPVLWGLVGIKLIIGQDILNILKIFPKTNCIEVIYCDEYTLRISTGIRGLDYVIDNFLFHHNLGEGLLFAMAVIWMIGVVVMLMYFVIAYLRVKRIVKESVPLVWRNVRLCDKIKQPFILGTFKPIVYMPSNVSDEEFNYILEHECAHIDRRDNIRKIVGYILICVHWFNPFVWMGYYALCKDIELACDEKAVSHFNMTEKKIYANILLGWSLRAPAILSGHLAFCEIAVKERVKAVFIGKLQSRKISVLVCAIILGEVLIYPDNAKAIMMDPTPNIYKVESEIHTQEEIDEVIEEILRINKESKEYGGWTLVNVYYIGDETSSEWNKEYYHVDDEDLMIIGCTWFNSSIDGTPVRNKGETMRGWKYIFIRNENDEWLYVDQGVC